MPHTSSLPRRAGGPLLAVMAVAALTACAQRVSPSSHALATPTPSSATAQTQALQEGMAREKTLNNGPIGGQNENLSNAELAALPQHLRVHFANNSFQVSARARKITQENARFLLRFPNLHVRLEGNCSQTGTQEYNLALGDWRAHAIKELLEADGVPARQISTVSFGKDNLLCTQNTPTCWRKNRRVDFVYRADS